MEGCPLLQPGNAPTCKPGLRGSPRVPYDLPITGLAEVYSTPGMASSLLMTSQEPPCLSNSFKFLLPQ